MIFSSGYERRVRQVGQVWWIWVRRARCKACGGRSHALLPAFCLIDRRYDAEVIGVAVTGVLSGNSTRSAARAAGVERSTVRAWCHRHRDRARWALAVAVAMTGALGASQRFPVEVWALLALGGLASAGPGGLSFWSAVSFATGGDWLVPVAP
jgi:hypothetical protein